MATLNKGAQSVISSLRVSVNPSSGARKPKLGVQAEWVTGGGPLPGFQMVICLLRPPIVGKGWVGRDGGVGERGRERVGGMGRRERQGRKEGRGRGMEGGREPEGREGWGGGERENSVASAYKGGSPPVSGLPRAKQHLLVPSAGRNVGGTHMSRGGTRLPHSLSGAT